METAKLYSFLLNVLIDLYRFPSFDIADEESFFVLRKYSDPSVRIDGIMIHVFLEKDVMCYKTFLTTNIAPNYRITNRCDHESDYEYFEDGVDNEESTKKSTSQNIESRSS